MLSSLPLENYLIKTERGYTPAESFYRLSLACKYSIYHLAEEAGIMTPGLYDKIVKGCLQHSSPESKIYKVKGERKLHPAAKAADMLEALNALYVFFDEIEGISEYAESLLPKIHAGYVK